MVMEQTAPAWQASMASHGLGSGPVDFLKRAGSEIGCVAPHVQVVSPLQGLRALSPRQYQLRSVNKVVTMELKVCLAALFLAGILASPSPAAPKHPKHKHWQDTSHAS